MITLVEASVTAARCQGMVAVRCVVVTPDGPSEPLIVALIGTTSQWDFAVGARKVQGIASVDNQKGRTPWAEIETDMLPKPDELGARDPHCSGEAARLGRR
jgi:hypothetical protein